MPRENLMGGLDNAPLTQLTGRQVNILRVLGKGSSFRDREISQEFKGNAIGDLGEIYRAFGVAGETAAVIHALDIGLLKTKELVVKDFDWGLFNTLKEREAAVLEAFTHDKGQSLTGEEFSALGIETAQDPKSFVSRYMQKAYERLGLRNKTQAVVHYYAFRERQRERGEEIVFAVKGILTDGEVQI